MRDRGRPVFLAYVLLVLDNRDSFTFNLVQLLRALGVQVEVRRADSLDVEGCRRLAPERILVGPGPGRPEQAGCSLDVLRELTPRIPTLGVCLGHQAVGLLCGAEVGSAPRLLHGHTVDVHHDGRGLFTGIPSPFPAARYNSLPSCLVPMVRTLTMPWFGRLLLSRLSSTSECA